MTTFEQTLLREVATLPEYRHADVLAFIRFLKISIRDDDELEQEYDESIQDARATAQKYNITQEVIDAEIRAVRDGK
jgi:phage regulator Rha-like protein